MTNGKVSSYTTLSVAYADGLRTVTLDRPKQRNAITNDMVRELRHAVETAAHDGSVRVLVLTGAEQAFCVGADLDGFVSGNLGEPVDADEFLVSALLHEMPAVTVAAINGPCAGAGLGWALACDLRFISASAKLNTAFLDVALAGDMAIPWSLPRLVGAGRARDLSFRPRRITAEQALTMGLVTEVFPDETFTTETNEVVRNLLRKAPRAIRLLKDNYLAAERMQLREFVLLEANRHLAMMDDAEAKEAFSAFLEKREPQFRSSV